MDSFRMRSVPQLLVWQRKPLPGVRATGRDANGGYAEYMVVREDFAYGIPGTFTDLEAAPSFAQERSAIARYTWPRQKMAGTWVSRVLALLPTERCTTSKNGGYGERMYSESIESRKELAQQSVYHDFGITGACVEVLSRSRLTRPGFKRGGRDCAVAAGRLERQSARKTREGSILLASIGAPGVCGSPQNCPPGVDTSIRRLPGWPHQT